MRQLVRRVGYRLGTLAVAAVLAACAARTSPRNTAHATTSSQRVQLLLVNDDYVIDTLRNGRGGLARVVALRDSIEKANGNKVLFVLAGDVLSPSVLGRWYFGAQMVEAYNVARLDIAALGNHEFDLTRPVLLERIAQSRFPWMSGNCLDASTGKTFPGVRGWDTVRVNGVKLGIFSTTVVMAYPSYVRCMDADAVTTALVDTLKQQGVDLVLGLTHRFIFEDSASLVREPRIDAILGGHEHDGRRAVINGRLLIKAQSNLRTVALVTFERNGTKWTTRDTVIQIGRGMREDQPTLAVVRHWQDSLVKRIGQDRVLGTAVEAIDAVDSVSRRGESRFGNLIADAMRIGTKADVAFINSGALRFDDVIAAGPVTRHMLEAIFLFADETRSITFPLSGARLRALLEHGVAQGSLGGGPYPQVSGVHFAFDARRPSNARIVGELTRDDGSVINPTDQLRVTFVVYPTCKGGDAYIIPEAKDACDAWAANPESLPRTVDLLLAHVERMNGRIVAPPLGRVTRLDRR